MLALREIGVHDVVVEEIRARAGRDRQQLVSGAMNENGAKSTDFGGDVDGHANKITLRPKSFFEAEKCN